MCTFIKWPSITNVNKLTQSDIEYIDNNYKTNWIITEKIDGTNFSVTVNENTYKLGRRNDFIKDNESFFDIQNNIEQLMNIIESGRDNFIKTGYCSSFIIYGEYFGPKIFNRVDYGTDYQFRIFSLRTSNSEWFSYSYLENMKYFIPFLVPRLKITDSLKEALNYPNNDNSTITNKDNNIMEGVVISPYKHLMTDYEMTKYLFKNKNEKFLEKSSTKKCKITDNKQELYSINELFKSYCTKSRMYSVFSKLGKPDKNTNVGKYIYDFIIDAFEEFEKDNIELVCTLTKSEKKAIQNIGSLGFNLFIEVSKELQ